MSKQQLQAQLLKEQAITQLLQANPEQAEFLKYLANKNPDASSDQLKMLAVNKDHADEYFFKISYLNKVHGVDGPTAGKILNAPAVTIQGMKHEIFTTVKPFMHYVSVNAIPVHIVDKYISQWKAAGLSLNMKDSKGQTPLDLALFNNRIDCVKAFSEWGVDLNELDELGFSPLHKLVQQVHGGDSQPEAIKTWCDFGLPTGTVSAQGWTPLNFAVGLGNVGAVFAFVEKGIGSTVLDNSTTVLHYCVAFDKVDIITKLIGKCDFNMKDSGNSPAITQALVQGKEDIANALVKGGTNLALCDESSGKTILHLLLEANMFPQAALAVQVGYDGNLKDLTGITPMDLLVNGISKGLCTDPSLSLAAVDIFCNIGKCIVELKHLEAIGASGISNKGDILGALKTHFVEKVEIVAEEPSAAVAELFAQLGIVPGQGEEEDVTYVAGEIKVENAELEQ